MYDTIFAGGMVVDGTGSPPIRADVGIRADRIAAVGDLSAAQARERIEALKPKAQKQVSRWAQNDARMLERERINATNAPAGKTSKKAP